MVSVPESLEGLLANPVMSGCVHHKHAEKHNVTGDATRLSVMNLHGQLRSDLCSLDIEEAARFSKGA